MELLEEQDRVLRSYYAQREGFDRGGQGTQGQHWSGYAGAGVGGRQPKLRLGRSEGAIVEFDNLAGC